jgi:hypothetical protein
MIQQYNILVVVDIAINILMAVDIAMQYIAHHRYCKNILYEVKTTNTITVISKRNGKEWYYRKYRKLKPPKVHSFRRLVVNFKECELIRTSQRRLRATKQHRNT